MRKLHTQEEGSITVEMLKEKKKHEWFEMVKVEVISQKASRKILDMEDRHIRLCTHLRMREG